MASGIDNGSKEANELINEYAAPYGARICYLIVFYKYFTPLGLKVSGSLGFYGGMILACQSIPPLKKGGRGDLKCFFPRYLSKSQVS